MALSIADIKTQLEASFGPIFSTWEDNFGIITVTVERQQIIPVLQHLKEDAALGFSFLTDICAVHYPDRVGEELAVVYHVHNMFTGQRLRIKLFTPVALPDVDTATGLYNSANWMERETYDFYGVNFVGHPNLKRILNVDEMDYFPLRKEFPLEDQSRVDKDDEMFGRGGNVQLN